MKADAAIKGRMLTSSIWNALLQMCALVCVLSLIGIFTLLLAKGGAVFSKVPFWDLLLGRDWIPSAYGTPKFGILGLIKSTFMVTLSAMVIAIPLGIGAAAWLSEFAPKLAREVIKPAVEMLAAIPSVAVGFFGLVVLGPVLVEVLKALGVPNPKGTCGLNGAILLGMMSLPTMISVAEDALRAVPRELREAAYGLGADRWQTLTRVTLPAAGSGLIAAIILGMGRALGETMTVVMVTGNAREFPTDILGPLKTMTATIAQELGETTADSTHYFALFAVGLLLFFISLAVNLVAEVFAAKFRRGGR